MKVYETKMIPAEELQVLKYRKCDLCGKEKDDGTIRYKS